MTLSSGCWWSENSVSNSNQSTHRKGPGSPQTGAAQIHEAYTFTHTHTAQQRLGQREHVWGDLGASVRRWPEMGLEKGCCRTAVHITKVSYSTLDLDAGVRGEWASGWGEGARDGSFEAWHIPVPSADVKPANEPTRGLARNRAGETLDNGLG